MPEHVMSTKIVAVILLIFWLGTRPTCVSIDSRPCKAMTPDPKHPSAAPRLSSQLGTIQQNLPILLNLFADLLQ